MALLASEVMDESRKVYLNDTLATLYTDAVMIPYVSRAYSEMQNRLHLAGHLSFKEVSSVIQVSAGVKTLTLPNDFIEPIKLQERAQGSTDKFTDMENQEWEDDSDMKEILEYWVYREDSIIFRGATTNRDVKLFYLKSLTPITTSNTSIPIITAKAFLSARAAELAARYIGQNLTLSESIRIDAEKEIDILVVSGVKDLQGFGVRRKPYATSRRVGVFTDGY